jgi:hypothetical protein
MEPYGAQCALNGSVTHALFQPRVTGDQGAETRSSQDRCADPESKGTPICSEVQRVNILPFPGRRKDVFHGLDD